jgi:hypothetical protein
VFEAMLIATEHGIVLVSLSQQDTDPEAIHLNGCQGTVYHHPFNSRSATNLSVRNDST